MPTTGSDGSLIRIGDLARLTGKTTRAIHLYEELGLLKPTTRSSGGFRLYESRAVDRVRWIELLHGMGFSLQEMKEVLEAWWRAELGPEAMSRLISSRCAGVVASLSTVEITAVASGAGWASPAAPRTIRTVESG